MGIKWGYNNNAIKGCVFLTVSLFLQAPLFPWSSSSSLKKTYQVIIQMFLNQLAITLSFYFLLTIHLHQNNFISQGKGWGLSGPSSIHKEEQQLGFVYYVWWFCFPTEPRIPTRMPLLSLCPSLSWRERIPHQHRHQPPRHPRPCARLWNINGSRRKETVKRWFDDALLVARRLFFFEEPHPSARKKELCNVM